MANSSLTTTPFPFAGTVIGSSEAGGDLTLQATSDASDGDIIFKSDSSTETARLNSDGRLLVGDDSTAAIAGITPKLQVASSEYTATGIGLINYDSDVPTVGPFLGFAHSRNNTVGSHTVVASGDRLGLLYWAGSDGDEFVPAAGIECHVDGTPGNDDMPGVLIFLTTPDGSDTVVERMRISNDGDVGIGTNTPGDFRLVVAKSGGDSQGGVFVARNTSASAGVVHSAHWSAVSHDDNSSLFYRCTDSTADRLYIWSDGDVQNHDNSYGAISDERLKQDIVDASSQWDDIKGVRLRKYKFISDVEAYGDKAVTHLGVVAQELLKVSPGLVQHNEAMDQYAVQYSILYLKAVGALQEAMARIEKLEAQVAQLTAKVK